MKQYITVSSIIIIVIITGYLLFNLQGNPFSYLFNTANTPNTKTIPTKDTCLSDDCLAVESLEYPVNVLSSSATKALHDALYDEYKALNTYKVVIQTLGTIRPFSMIKGAEEQHIASLKTLFDKYGITIPANTLKDTIQAPTTKQQACQIGVDAEIANARLYKEKLLPAVNDYPDITNVFEHLMNASEQKHLPAFERCN